MSGLTAALNSGKTGLFTNQKLIEVAGNNINNVNTPGYSRQQAEIGSLPTLEINGFFVGTGSNVETITREHNVFISRQIWAKNAALGEESAKSIPMTELENIFNISDQNLASEIDQFFDAWQELATNPSGQIERDNVMQYGDQLAGTFQQTALGLDRIQQDINSTFVSEIGAINLKLQQVAELNTRIADIEATGQTANAYQDQRDMLVEELSKTLGVQSYKENNGMVTVQLVGGLPLVQLDEALTLEAVPDGENLKFQLRYNNTTLDLGLNNFGGEFKGMLSIRDEMIPSLNNTLDNMAYNLVNEVNAQHQAGVGLDNNTYLFFNGLSTEKNASRNISLAVQNTNEIAVGASAAPGDNTNALLIAALRDKKMINGKETLDEAYGRMSSTVGIEAAQSQLALDGTQDALVQLENLRDGITGVSLEEEMINLIQYQAGFQASSKYLAIVDDMMDSLLSIKR
jgi:flagellar hook-associated protein 1 FlgK